MKLPSLSGCSCGRDHTASTLPQVEIGPDVTTRLPELLASLGLSGRCHVVWDRQTRAAASELTAALRQADLIVTETLFSNMQHATLAAAEEIRQAGQTADFFLAVGSGSLGDLTKYASHRSGCPYVMYATAPSMDGFLSVGAALYHDGFKDSFDAAPPRLVLGDTGVLAAAPTRLKAAGFGDLLGKYTSLCDWECAHLLTGEYWCPQLAALTRQAADRAVALSCRIPQADPDAAAALMEGLCLSGLAMLLCGNSRPASGAEHHLSHFWEMLLARDGGQADLHGRQVGVAAALVDSVYRSALEQGPLLRPRQPERPALEAIFGPLTEQIRRENTPDPLESLSESRILDCWPQIQSCLAQLPTPEQLTELLSEAGGAVLPQQLGLSTELCRQALFWGCYTRRRLTLLRLLDPRRLT